MHHRDAQPLSQTWGPRLPTGRLCPVPAPALRMQRQAAFVYAENSSALGSVGSASCLLHPSRSNQQVYHFRRLHPLAVQAAEFPKSILRYRNDEAASAIGLDSLSDADFIRHFARFVPLADNIPQPLALRYHGHQFGVYNPDIGDGRGFLFAQCRQEATGRVLDLGTKGSGRTPYARTADGRLTLKGAVREILATEMLTALNVPTSQTFCVIETGESLDRQDEPSPTRSAVLTRMLHSHIRIGSFQRLAYLRQQENLEILLRHTIKYYYPDLDSQSDLKELIPDFLGQLAAKIARMVAGWMAAGFVHGVLNTDNFNITGESFDYGPWRFLPAMQPGFTAAYFDQQKRYAYGRQPEAALWALCRLADCFQTILDAEALGVALASLAMVSPPSTRSILPLASNHSVTVTASLGWLRS